MPIDEALFTTVSIGINSGSSLLVKAEILRVLAVDEGAATITTNAVGNITLMAAVIERSRQRAAASGLLRVPGITSVSFSAAPAGYGTVLPDSDLVARLAQWVLHNDVLVQFAEGGDGVNGVTFDNTYTGAIAGTTVAAYVTDGDGTRSLLNDVSTVALSVSGGSASAPKINGVDGPVTLTCNNGKVSAVISASGAGTVLLALSSPTHPSVDLIATDTATVNLS